MARRRYNKACADRILEHLNKGASLRVAAGSEGVTVEEVYDWQRRRQDFATALLKARSIVAREVAFGNKEAAEEDDKLAERFLLRLGQETALDRLRELTCG